MCSAAAAGLLCLAGYLLALRWLELAPSWDNKAYSLESIYRSYPTGDHEPSHREATLSEPEPESELPEAAFMVVMAEVDRPVLLPMVPVQPSRYTPLPCLAVLALKLLPEMSPEDCTQPTQVQPCSTHVGETAGLAASRRRSAARPAVSRRSSAWPSGLARA